MRERVCKNCGGRQYKVVGQNMVKCQFCGTLYVDEQASKEEEILTVSAYEQLRECNFEKAVSEFDKILSLYPMSFEAFFGRMLSKNKIVMYPNKRGSTKYPRFFGENIAPIWEDEDFVSAVKNAPEEIAINYNDTAKRIERESKRYEEIDKSQAFDLVLYVANYDKENPNEKIVGLKNRLESENIKTYFLQDLDGKEREANTFFAIKSANAFVVIANDDNIFGGMEIKNLLDRYRYFISQKEKYSKSFIIATSESVVNKSEYTEDFSFCKNFVDFESDTFIQDLVSQIKNVSKFALKEVSKIETRKIENATPQKKKYVNIENVTPTELGHYKVENVEVSEANKIRWVFLSLKNGDFASTKKTITAELKKDPNNAEMLFAELLCDQKLHTAGEFFESITHFQDKEKIEKILQYSNKEFAEMFIDNWELLLEKLDSEDYYNAFILYLAKYDTPNRENFILAAENKAVETLDEDLIQNVLKCFRSDEVEKYINFYFMLAQKSGNYDYYDKILDIDAGHEQSNIAVLLKNFKTDKDKLTFRDREKIENSLKFMNEKARFQFVSSVISLILPVAFKNIEEAEKQIDFYLSYVDETNVDILKKVSFEFLNMNFFKQAEKYILLAISRDKTNAELYWELIKIKAHCKNNAEIMVSSVDISQMPEWETLLNYADEEQTEKYAEIVSRAHLFEGERQNLKMDFVDQIHLKEELSDFIDRNEKILLECQKENGEIVLKGVQYYKLQISPFENYLKSLEGVKNFDEYAELSERINDRLKLLDLTLDSSISVLKITEKGQGLKNTKVLKSITKESEALLKKEKKQAEHKKFWKWFCYGFFEVVPAVLLITLFSLIIANPKMVYMYLPQTFIFGMLAYVVAVGLINFVVYLIKKKSLRFVNVFFISLLIILVFTNVILFGVSFLFVNKTIEIKNSKEFVVLVQNAQFSSLILDDDINLENKDFSLSTFHGELNGNGHKIYNLALRKGKNIAFVNANYGMIKNLNIVLSDKSYENFEKFAGLVSKNYGEIENCSVSGSIKLKTDRSSVVGGIVSNLCSGAIKNCENSLGMTISFARQSHKIGGIIGQVVGESAVTHNISNAIILGDFDNSDLAIGGICGYLGSFSEENIDFSRNTSVVQFSIDGNIEKMYIGGLVGNGFSNSKNNIATGEIKIEADVRSGYVGGLYGEYTKSKTSIAIENSVSAVNISSSSEGVIVAGLVGGKSGRLINCYTNNELELVGINLAGTAQANCDKNIAGYDTKFGFDPEIWNGVTENSDQLPQLK